MQKLFITKHVAGLGEAREYLLMVAQTMNDGHHNGDGWNLAETPDEMSEEIPASKDEPETNTVNTQAATNAEITADKNIAEDQLPWSNKNKRKN